MMLPDATAVPESRSPDYSVHGIGLFLLTCLLLGGGTDAGLTNDYILQFLALPFVLVFALSFPRQSVDWLINMLVWAILAVLVMQLIPTFGINGRPFVVSIDGGRTLNSALLVLVWLACFHVIMRKSPAKHDLIVLYILIGTLLNFFLSFLQFASGGSSGLGQLFEYQNKAGFFANENHLAALFYVSVPLIVATCSRLEIRFLEIPILVSLLCFQFVVGSRAGVALTLLSVLASYALLSRLSLIRLVLGVTAILAALTGLWLISAELWSTGGGALDRGTFAAKTWQAALDHAPLGIGFGNFTLIYPRYESIGELAAKYVNHAHNDYLELLLEGSLLAFLLIAAYFVLLARRLFTAQLSGLQKGAALAICFLLAHSLVDYPLRTMALGVLFATLNAILFSTHSKTTKISQKLVGEA